LFFGPVIFSVVPGVEIDDAGIHIFRPGGFVFIGGLTDAIFEAAPVNIKLIQADLPVVDSLRLRLILPSILGLPAVC
jgi:hypothetical protein